MQYITKKLFLQRVCGKIAIARGKIAIARGEIAIAYRSIAINSATGI
jgi:hypothetical protein